MDVVIVMTLTAVRLDIIQCPMPIRRTALTRETLARGLCRLATASGLCLVSACSGLDSVPPLGETPKALQPSEQTLEATVKGVFQSTKLPGTPEMSALRKADPLAPAEWIVCVRSNVAPTPIYALFFKGGAYAHHRLAVLYDHCGREVFVPVKP